jgi:hypothetical protein
MKRRTLLVSVLLVVPAVAWSQQPPQAITLRACVQQGTHGSIGNLNQIEVKAPAVTPEGRPVLYWFHKNVAGFRDHIGHLVEIAANVVDVIDGPVELKATDGVFAEAPPPAVAAAVGGSGAASERPVATSGGGSAIDPDARIVVKAEVDRLRMIGTCR